jgi:hypothetical protein
MVTSVFFIAAMSICGTTKSKLNFLKDKHEWDNTKIVFKILEQDDCSLITFTHVGLLPGIACYKDCSNAWRHYLPESLSGLLTEGKGRPEPIT